MERSKLISILIAKLKVAYPYYFKNLNNEEFLQMTKMYQEELKIYDVNTMDLVIKNIIKNYDFMPSLKEVIDEFDKIRLDRKYDVIEKMKEDGYFKSPKELDKIYKFLEDGIIPSWFLEDMKKYGYQDELEYSKNKLLNQEGK